ncbi:MAG: hypothetical protein L7F78_20835 [Syntrophales bacterium LBB04]|nr:hypothetical protein [Syntrophales bacterium LBB04]
MPRSPSRLNTQGSALLKGPGGRPFTEGPIKPFELGGAIGTAEIPQAGIESVRVN